MRSIKRIPVLGKMMAIARRIDWRRREVRDGVVIFGLTSGLYAWAHFDNVPPRLFDFAVEHGSWALDDTIFAVFMLSPAIAIYALRRMQDLGREIQARHTAEAIAQKLARHDPLTGLPNRRFFNETLDEILGATLTDNRRLAVLMLDLDGFKAINDVHGHLAGDKALIDLAERVGDIRVDAVIARVGGDEFAIILSDIASLDEPAGLAHRITSTMAAPFTVAGTKSTLSVSIGIAIAPDDGTSADELVRRADLALYRAKADGHSLTRFFEPMMDAHVERRTRIEQELRAAVAGDHIQVHYQPLVSLADQRITGFEALARWSSPKLGAVAPNIFIAIAEESGLIHRLADQLLRTACREAKKWPSDYTLSFNISPLQLHDPSFGLRVLAVLSDTGLSPSRLELEITESAIVGDAILARRLIDELRSAGVRIALDDFGTGYATMSQLLSFHFDKIKIDRSFVNRLGSDVGSAVIVRAIIGLAKALGLTTTAEGIENALQLADLTAAGCIEGQGFLFGNPIPAAEIPALLAKPASVDAVA